MRCFVCGDPNHKANVCNFRARGEEARGTGEEFESPPVQRMISDIPNTEYKLEGLVDDVPVCILLDSGASRTFMNFEKFENIFPGRDFEERGTQQNAKGPNGEPIVVKGSVQMKLRVGNFDENMEIILAEDLDHDLILGMDFITKHVSQINPKDENIILDNGEKVNMKLSLVNSPKLKYLVASSKSVVPAKSVVYVPCVIKGASPSDRLLCVESTIPFTQKYNAILPYGLYDSQAKGTFTKVSNVENYPIEISIGSRIAVLQNCEIVSDVRRGFSAPRGVTPEDVHTDLSLLDSIQKLAFLKILNEYKDVFAKDGDKPGRTDVLEHRIDLEPNAKPFKIPARRVPIHLEKEVTDQVSNLFGQKIIENSSSEFSSPPVLVKKKDGTFRFCVDYRKLNGMTIKDSYPLPRIDETFDSIGPKTSLFDIGFGHGLPSCPHS